MYVAIRVVFIFSPLGCIGVRCNANLLKTSGLRLRLINPRLEQLASTGDIENEKRNPTRGWKKSSGLKSGIRALSPEQPTELRRGFRDDQRRGIFEDSERLRRPHFEPARACLEAPEPGRPPNAHCPKFPKKNWAWASAGPRAGRDSRREPGVSS